MFCGKCGKKTEDSARFCDNCGKELMTGGRNKPTSEVEFGMSTTPHVLQKPIKNDMKSNLFSFKGRLNRSRYFWRSLALALPNACLYALTVIMGFSLGLEIMLVIMALSFMISAICFVSSLSLTVRRAHDLNKGGRYVWWLLLPVVNLFVMYKLLFVKGTEGSNDFGEDPLEVVG